MVSIFLAGTLGVWPGSVSTGIVPEESAVSDVRARIALVQALLKTTNGRNEAIDHLRILQKLALSKPEILPDLADIQTALGHYRAVYVLYGQLVLNGQNNQALEHRLADNRLLWGDFYGSERYWRKVLAENPGNVQTTHRLAAALVGADRYDEAEAIYSRLWTRPPHDPQAGVELARVYMLQKRFQQASETARNLQGTQTPTFTRAATVLRAEALQTLGELREAEMIFAGLANGDAASAEDWVRLGIVQSKLGRHERAKESFATALERNPRHVEAAFRFAGKEFVDTDGFTKDLFVRENDPARLGQWAELYVMAGLRQRALACYEQALQSDPDYFPAAEGRAFVLAISGEHEAAAKYYRELTADFPESRKLRVGLARALAWGRQYDKSLEIYDHLVESHPHDLLLQREAARVALWGKMFDEAMARYDRILTPSVDEQLYNALLPISEDFHDTLLQALQRLAQQKEDGSGYDGYPDWRQMVENNELPDAATEIVDGLNGCYAMQLAIAHERAYKSLQWRHRYTRARGEVSQLIALTPGDQEAVFDRAQMNCMQGRCDRAISDYEHLLQLDPTHSIAAEALDLAQLDARAGLRARGSYWNERGRGGLSDIRRYTAACGLDIPVYCQNSLFMESRRWFEFPGNYDGHIESWSHNVGLRGVFGSCLKGELLWTYKQYDHDRYDDTHVGQGSLWANLNDYAHLGAGFERKDELYNRFGFANKTQSDNTWTELKSDLTRRWDAAVRLHDIRYNDDNRGHSIFLNTGFDVTDHPGIFNVALSAEHRNTEHESQYFYDTANILTDIIHPYWTPRDYWAVFLTLEWWHDISGPHQYCGNRRHYYNLKATMGSDTESNPGLTLEAEWQYRFTRRWFCELNGYVHRSREWDAEGLWLSLGCQL